MYGQMLRYQRAACGGTTSIVDVIEDTSENRKPEHGNHETRDSDSQCPIFRSRQSDELLTGGRKQQGGRI